MQYNQYLWVRKSASSCTPLFKNLSCIGQHTMEGFLQYKDRFWLDWAIDIIKPPQNEVIS